MTLIIVAHSSIVTALLDESGSIQQVYDDLDDNVANGIQDLQKGKESAVVTDSNNVSEFLNQKAIKHSLDMNNEILKDWRLNRFEKLLENTGKVSSYEDYQSLVKSTSRLEARNTIKQAAGKRDELAAQVIHTIDDLQKTFNLNANRLYEIYSLHFPELVDNISNPTTLAKLIIDYPERKSITREALEKYKLSEDKIEYILASVENSLGGDYSVSDLHPIIKYAEGIVELSNQLTQLEVWIDKEMETIAPNVTAVAGANVSARLISAFGSLRDLAMKSSSKIQTVGAEKALYSALKKNGSPPKHGIIFQIPEIGNSPYWLRGKIARAYSGKIAIAARLDTFKGEFLGTQLRDGLRELEAKLRERYPVAPVKKRDESRQTHPMRRQRRRRRPRK
ncbi:MAG: putative NOP5 family protein [Candidatus Heimdallarchaeota archaeon LC_2]|nr:MAG: putative NOP5 family protein [Candidatus Heimdallarchaeota archaeon LC_2]